MTSFKRTLTILVGLSAIVFTLAVVRADHAGNDDPDVTSLAVQMATTANAILATMADGPTGIESAVGYDRRELLQLDFTDDARTNYVYWPYLRKGLPLEYMTSQQKILTHGLLNTALSAKGYLSAIQVMQLEKLLADAEVVGFPRGPENYTLAIFGSPGVDSNWGWRFEGHHLSLNFAVANGEISVTPTFFGASPAVIRTGTLAGFRNQNYIHDAGLALINALRNEQREQAIEDGNPPFDIMSGTLNRPRGSWDDWKSLPQTGIAIGSLDAKQKQLAQRILDEVVTVYRPEISRAYLAQVDVNELHFTWYGSTLGNEPHYWRLDGPDFFFEYDLVQGDGNHVHAVWRSKEGDFGADLLLQHRTDSH